MSRSMQIVPISFLVNRVEKWLCREPACSRRPNGIISHDSIFLIDLDSLSTSARSGSIRHQLGVATLLEADEPEYRFLYSAADRQQAMVLEQRCLLVAKAFRDVLALFLG
jgi:hypothetical protein